MGQASHTKQSSHQDNERIGFKFLHYEVAESSQSITITVEKKVDTQIQFKVRTIDGTARAGHDYQAFFKSFMMLDDEREKDF